MSRIHIRAALTAGLTGLILLISGTPAFAQAPDPRQATPEEKAAAVIRPAIVYLQSSYSGFVYDETGVVLNNVLNGGAPYQFTSTCTGFVVNPNGYIATAGHCVDIGEQGARGEILAAAVQQAAQQLPGIDPAAQLQFAHANYRTEGAGKDSPIDREVVVIRGTGTGSSLEGKSVPAQVVEFSPLGKGDVAVLKVAATDLPAIELAPDNAVQTGTRLLSVGYPASTAKATDPSLNPTFKDGQLSNKTTSSAVPVYEISAAVSEGMSGGPTVGLDGRAIGVNSFKVRGEAQSFNFVAPASVLNEMLGRNNIRAELGPNDRTYRAGLDDYYAGRFTDAIAKFDQVLAVAPGYAQATEFKTNAAKAKAQFGDAGPGVLLWVLIGGGVLLLVLVVGGVLLLMRRNRRRTQAGGPGSPPMGAPMQYAAAPAQPAAPQGPGAPVATATPAVSAPAACARCGKARESDGWFCSNCGHQF